MKEPNATRRTLRLSNVSTLPLEKVVVNIRRLFPKRLSLSPVLRISSVYALKVRTQGNVVGTEKVPNVSSTPMFVCLVILAKTVVPCRSVLALMINVGAARRPESTGLLSTVIRTR